MPEEHFAFERRFQASRPGGQRIAIYAFKPWKLRIYGGFVHAEGKQVFIGTEVVEKKQNKADRDALERAAKRLEEFL